MSTNRLHHHKGYTHIIAPVDGALVRAANAAAVARAGSVGRSTGDTIEVLDSVLGSSPLSVIEYVADKRLELVFAGGLSGHGEYRAVGLVVDAKVLAEVGVDLVEGSINLLNGAGHVHGRTVRVGLDFPGDVLDAVAGNGALGQFAIESRQGARRNGLISEYEYGGVRKKHKLANGSSYLKNGQNDTGNESRGAHDDDVGSRVNLEARARK